MCQMIVVRFPPVAHFRLRALEWGLAGILLTAGIVLLNPYPTFEQPIFVEMKRIANELTWALICTMVGVVRLSALYVNGAWRKSPWIRLGTALVSSLIWLQLTLGLVSQPVVTLGVAIFPWFIAADWYSIWRAASDASENRKAKEQLSSVTA